MGPSARPDALSDAATDLASVARLAAAQLTTVVSTPEGAFIQTPLMYPGGSSVVTHVVGLPDRYFVSDYGHGAREAEMAGVSHQFTAIARNVAERAGVSFDERCLFVADLRGEQLSTAVAVIANCSMRAVGLSIMKLAQRRHEIDDRFLYDKLIHIFGRPRVQRHADILGSSNREWRVSAVVHTGERRAVFEVVRPAPASIYRHVTMFHDIARLDPPPARIAVVESFQRIGPDNLGLLGQAARVIEQEAPDERFLAAA
jgi:hypothetical protein